MKPRLIYKMSFLNKTGPSINNKFYMYLFRVQKNDNKLTGLFMYVNYNLPIVGVHRD